MTSETQTGRRRVKGVATAGGGSSDHRSMIFTERVLCVAKMFGKRFFSVVSAASVNILLYLFMGKEI